MNKQDIKQALQEIGIQSNAAAQKRWPKGNSYTLNDKLLHLHSEVSEVYDAHRKGNPPSEHLPNCDSVSEELADVLILICGIAQEHNIPLGEIVIEKLKFNATR